MSDGGCFIISAPSRSGARFKFLQKAKEVFDIEESMQYSDVI